MVKVEICNSELGDHEFTINIGKTVGTKGCMCSQTSFQDIKARGKCSEHRGTQEMM